MNMHIKSGLKKEKSQLVVVMVGNACDGVK